VNNKNFIYDLRKYPVFLSKKLLTSMIEATSPKEDFNIFAYENRNMDGIKALNPAKHALTVKRCDMRALPTEEPMTKNGFDRLQETCVHYAEPVIILHESCDKLWNYIQIYNYRGWVKSDAFAIPFSDKTWFDFAGTVNFLVMTDPFYEYNDTEIDMGVRLPILGKKDNCYIAVMPVLNNKKLDFENILIPEEKACEEYLKFNISNWFSQIYKYIGTSYCWGEKGFGVDCGSFIVNVLSCFGCKMPRNVFQQEQVLKDFAVVTEDYPLGSLLYIEGHVMVYLGKKDNQPMVLHAFGREEYMCVCETPTGIPIDANQVIRTCIPVNTELINYLKL
jgi:hypothetical protein